MAGPAKPLRADGRRNRARIIDAAREAVARDGADASLEQVARAAGVGSATLHRHFSSRSDLLQAVFHDDVEQLCRRAGVLAEALPAQRALTQWLAELTARTAATRGLAASLVAPDAPASTGSTQSACYAALRAAGAVLLSSATAAGGTRPGVTVDDLLDLVNAVSLVKEGDGPAASHLFTLVQHGITARPPAPDR